MSKALVAIIVASDSDLSVMSKAINILEEFGIPHEITISSAHRSPQKTVDFVTKVHKEGVKVIIASAGLAAHLAGVVASHFPLPVIGVPIKSEAVKGLDALLSTVQMPPGIPVATVGIDNAKNAGILAVQILATSNIELEQKLIAYKNTLAVSVEKKAEKLEKLGYEKYLEEK